MLEREAANQVLQQTADILEDLGIAYWIDSGTLLSAYRDKDINIYDHDIDIRVYQSQFTNEREAELVRALWLGGFFGLQGVIPWRLQILGIHEKSVLLDFKFCPHDDEHLWYCCWDDVNPEPKLHVFPLKFFHPLGKIELLGREYPCPQPIEEYIEYHYGADWRKFKVRPEDANGTDLTWDYLKDPPCLMTLGEFNKLKKDVYASL